MNSKRLINQAAFRQMKSNLDERFPRGHFVAFDEGCLIADAENFDKLTDVLRLIDRDRSDVFVVQTGVEYPEELVILL
jgi:hypothetical protein